MKYSSTGFTDDTYKWQYAVGASAWSDLTTATNVKFDVALGSAQFRSFSQLAEPNDGTWDWTDIADLKVRVYLTKVGTAWDGTSKNIKIYEVWASVYSSPTPPVSSTTMSLQPQHVSPLTVSNDPFFVEVYINDVTNLAAFQVDIRYDNTTVTPLEFYTYYPWTDLAGINVDETQGNVTFAGTIPVDDPLVSTGLSGGQAVARIYFTVDDDGNGIGTPMPPNFSWLTYKVSFVSDPQAVKVPHSVYHGYYGTPPPNTYLEGSDPIPRPMLFPYTEPISTNWVEQYPNLGNKWHLTSWNTLDSPDNGNGYLDPSDQIDMTPTDPTGLKQYFHVDQIWGCDADPNTYVYMILTKKPEVPEFPLGIGMLMAIVPLIPIAYLWRTRRKVMKK